MQTPEGKKPLATKKEERKGAQFKEPYSFTRTLLGQQKSGTLCSLKPEVEEFLQEVHSDPNGGQGLGDTPNIPKPGRPLLGRRPRPDVVVPAACQMGQ